MKMETLGSDYYKNKIIEENEQLNQIEQDHICADQMSFLSKGRALVVFVNLTAALILLLFVESYVPFPLSVTWFSFVAISMFFRLALFRMWRNDPDRIQPEKWLSLYTGAMFFTASAWGSSVVFLIASNGQLDPVYFATFLAGVATLAIINGSAHFMATYAFIIPALVPLSVFSILQEHEDSVKLGFILSAFLIFLIYVGHKAHTLVYGTLVLKNKNDLLVSKAMEQARKNKKSYESIQHLLDQMGAGVALFDKNFNLLLWNKSCYQIFNFPNDYLGVGLNIKDILRSYYRSVGKTADRINELIQERMTEYDQGRETGNINIQLNMADGKIFDIKGDFLEDGSTILNFTDVTHRAKANAEALFQMGQKDPLSGLPNRLTFKSQLKKILRISNKKKCKVVITLLNIDNFKFVNDTYSVSVGDSLIIEIATIIQNNLDENEYLAHFGGDEFGIIGQYDLNSKRSLELAEKLSQQIKEPISINGESLNTDVSIGLTQYPEDDRNVNNLLRNADIALHKAKKEGHGKIVIYNNSMHFEIQNRNIMVNEIRESLASSQFILHYQPQIDLKTRQISGVEALMRWRHPDKGWISPAEFIPLAELSKQIIPLTEQLLPEACQQAQSWQEQGLPIFPVSVNISPLHFKEKSFVPLVRKCLEEANLEPERLDLEITEGIIMDRADESISTLKELYDLGVKLSIDDFGTGYSSLTYLRSLPVHNLKIDQSFIHDMLAETDSRSVIAAIIQLGHSFDLKIIAEGVEKLEELELLAEMKCDCAQGYHIGRPMPPDKLTQWIKEHL